jgi:hypothetical protein
MRLFEESAEPISLSYVLPIYKRNPILKNSVWRNGRTFKYGQCKVCFRPDEWPTKGNFKSGIWVVSKVIYCPCSQRRIWTEASVDCSEFVFDLRSDQITFHGFQFLQSLPDGTATIEAHRNRLFRLMCYLVNSRVHLTFNVHEKWQVTLALWTERR